MTPLSHPEPLIFVKDLQHDFKWFFTSPDPWGGVLDFPPLMGLALTRRLIHENHSIKDQI